MRPYQLEGFHFLAYLTANRFGGVLADDMGLGKTLQTLTWLSWLRKGGAGVLPAKTNARSITSDGDPSEGAPATTDACSVPLPTLVVCPKSSWTIGESRCNDFFPGCLSGSGAVKKPRSSSPRAPKRTSSS